MFGTDHFATTVSGVRTIDASRKCLSFVLGRLFHPRVICAAPGGRCTRIEDTILFVRRNLDREDRLMTEAAYPGFAAHKREHKTLLSELDGMRRTLICGSYDNALVSDFLTDWTRRHTASFDKPFGEFLHDHATESSKGGES